eukprot:TRINITY_DN0_c0_g1_i4.p1 TRINITY_DN0_c0_g1~~TRINITY_DN0_c0_g1_i4.p1  ORF type:complete len:1528 (+),score=304.66 TRINITY_DN0_c0_g1_i4:2257-6840(+)
MCVGAGTVKLLVLIAMFLLASCALDCTDPRCSTDRRQPHNPKQCACYFGLSQPMGRHHYFKPQPAWQVRFPRAPKRNPRKLAETMFRLLMRCGDVHPNPGPKGPKTLLVWKNGHPRLRQQAQQQAATSGTRGPLPGPPTPVTQTTTRPNELSITTVNLTSMKNQEALCLGLGSTVIAVQETALTQAGQEDMRASLYKNGYRALWGPPQEGRLIEDMESVHIAVRGGVGILVKKDVPAYSDNSVFEGMGQKNRVTHAKIAIGSGKTWIHVISLYAKDGTEAADKSSREQLLDEVLNRARTRLGEVPVIVAGDFNASPDRSPVLAEALRTHWVDAAAVQASIDGCDPPPTFMSGTTSGTRIDYILMNPTAATTLLRCKTHPTRFPGGHRPVTADLSLPAFRQTVERYHVPREIPKPPTTHEVRPATSEGFRAAIRDKNVERAWLELSRSMEDYLLDANGIANKEERRKYTGRGEANRRTMMVRARTTKFSEGAATQKQIDLHRTANQLQEIVTSLKKHKAPGCLPKSLEDRIKAANKNTEKLNLGSMNIKLNPDTLTEAAKRMHEKADTMAKDARKEARLKREANAAEEVKSSFGKVRRTITAFLWRGTTEQQGAVAMRRRDGTTTADVEEMDEMLHRAWDPVFRKYKNKQQPQYGRFKDRYARYIRRANMTCAPLTGDDLWEVLKKKSEKGACGVDGWRNSELKCLPREHLNDLATLLNLVEETGEWPVALTKALVTPIPKDDTRTPLKHRPITVTSCIYRLWACARLRQILRWQEEWIHATQKGFRPKHRADDVLFDISLQIEDALMGGEPLHGVALDFAKCFDTVPQQLTLELMRDLGLDPKVLRPLRTMYNKLERRFKLPLGVGKPYEVTNGILQGCPISVVMVNALLSTVVKCIEAEVPGASTLSYADDMYLLTRLRAAQLQGGMAKMEEFCSLTGMELNHEKSHVFSTKGVKDILHGGVPLSRATRLKALGAYLVTHVTSRTDSERIDAAIEAARRLGATRLSFDQKVTIISETIIPTALYGALYMPPPTTKLNELLTAIAGALTGPHFNTRSPGALTTIVLKAHVCDPLAAMQYRMLKAARDQTARLNAADTVQTLLAKKIDEKGHTAGPIGILSHRVLQPTCVVWRPVSDSLKHEWWEKEKYHTRYDMSNMTKAQIGHAFREVCRISRWGDLESRKTLDGIGQGVNTERTNALRIKLLKTNPQAAVQMTRVLTGGLFYKHPNSRRTQDSGDGKTLQKCENCAFTVVSKSATKMTRHVYWECPAHKEVRDLKVYEQFVNEWKDWDNCLALHGVLTHDTEIEPRALEQLQSLLLNVLRDRDAKYTQQREVEHRTAPWHRLWASVPVAHEPTPVKTLVKKGWALDAPTKETMLRIEKWLGTIRWTTGEGSVSCIELVIDLEASYKRPLLGLTTPWRERAGTFRRLLNNYCRACKKYKLPNPLPCNPVKRVHSLRTIGGPTVIGYDRRPFLIASTLTSYALDTLVASEDPRHWGKRPTVPFPPPRSETNNTSEPMLPSSVNRPVG